MWRRLLRGLFRSPARDIEVAPPRPAGRDGGARPAPRREWAGVPPLRTGLQQPIPQASGIGAFTSAMVGRHRGVRHLAPLGHEVVPQAPRGVVTGLARAVRMEPAPAPLISLPLADRSARGRRRGGERRVLRWPAADDDRPSRHAAAAPAPPVEPPHTTTADVPATGAPTAAAAGTGPPDTPVTPVMPARPPASSSTGDAPDPATGRPAAGPAVGPPTAAARRLPSTGATRTSSRPPVHDPPRVLRAATPVLPAVSPRTSPPRPRGLPLRPLATHRDGSRSSGASETGPSTWGSSPGPTTTAPPQPPADVPASEVPDGPPAVEGVRDGGELPPEAPAAPDPAATAPAASPDPAPDPAPDPEGATAPVEVRPTLGARDRSQPDDASPPAVQRDADDGVAWSGRLGIGAPMASLPASARAVTDGPRPGPSVTGRGRHEAIARGLERLSARPGPAPGGPRPKPVPGSPDAGTTSPTRPPRPAREAVTRVGRRIDPTLPPVVARRVAASVTTAPTPPPGPGDVRPVTGQREPLVSRPPGDDVEPDGPEDAGSGSARAAPSVPVRWSAPQIPPVARATAAPPPVQRMEAARSRGVVPGAGPGSTGRTSTRPASSGRRRPPGDAGPPPSDAPLGELPAVFADHPLVERLRRSRTETNARPADHAAPATPPRSLPLAPSPVQRAPSQELSEPSTTRSPQEPPTAATATPVQRSASTHAAATEPAPDAPGPIEPRIDDLFDELYPRVRDELRWELRAQRERAGLLCDPL